MKTQNVWDNLNFDENKPNILKVLKGQAQLLADKTKGILYAEVNPVDAFDENTFDMAIVYNFYVFAPYLGNIRTLIFTVGEVSNKIILVDRIGDKGKSTPQSIDDLVNKIGDIISGNECSSLITSLYASSLENIPVNKRSR